MRCARTLVWGFAMRCARTLVWGFAMRCARTLVWGVAMRCARTLVCGFATGCVVFGLEKRNRDLNHKNLRIDLVQIKKFRSGP